MTQRTNSAMLQQPDNSRSRSKWGNWVSWLLMAAACVYGVVAVLVVAMDVPAWVVWGSLTLVGGLVALACLVGTARAVWAKMRPPMVPWQGYRSVGIQGAREPVQENR